MDPGWNDYPNTILDLAGGDRIDLREPITAATPLPFDRQPFGVITAYNPGGVVTSDAINQRADTTLASRLSALRLPAVRATGRSPDNAHAEPGYAVRAPRPQLLELAEEFGQAAVFWFDGEGFAIWPTTGPPTILPLGT
jgi:hypothetical protein